MSEKDTIEKISPEEIDEKIDKGQEKVNDAIGKGKDKVDEKIDKSQEKINKAAESGKNIADKVANDFSKGVDKFFVNLKTTQKRLNEKINEYNKSNVESLDVDIVEDAENYYVKAATPGVDKEGIEIEAGDYEITIQAEFPTFKEEINASEDAETLLTELKSGKCIKNITFINQIDIHNIKASYDKGATIVTIPKIKKPKTKVTVE